MDIKKVVPFYQGESAAGILSKAGNKFDSKDSWINFLEGLALIALKDALCLSDDFHNPNVANAVTAQQALGRAVVLLTMVAKNPGELAKDVIQERGAAPEVSGNGEAGPNGSVDPGRVGEGDQRPKHSRPGRPKKQKTASH